MALVVYAALAAIVLTGITKALGEKSTLVSLACHKSHMH
jgi:hypothetical protein